MRERGILRGGPYLGVGQELVLVAVQQRPGVGLGVVHVDLDAGVLRGAPAVGATGEGALEHLADLLHRQHRAVGRRGLQILQRGTEPAEAEDEERHDAGDDEKQAEPDALVLGFRVLVSHPELRHRPPLPAAGALPPPSRPRRRARPPRAGGAAAAAAARQQGSGRPEGARENKGAEAGDAPGGGSASTCSPAAARAPEARAAAAAQSLLHPRARGAHRRLRPPAPPASLRPRALPASPAPPPRARSLPVFIARLPLLRDSPGERPRGPERRGRSEPRGHPRTGGGSAQPLPPWTPPSRPAPLGASPVGPGGRARGIAAGDWVLVQFPWRDVRDESLGSM